MDIKHMRAAIEVAGQAFAEGGHFPRYDRDDLVEKLYAADGEITLAEVCALTDALIGFGCAVRDTDKNKAPEPA